MDRISQLFEHFQFDYLASPLFPPRKSTSKHTVTTKLWSLINILTRDDDWWVYMSATWFLSLFTHQKPCLKICFFIPEKPQMLEVLVIYWPANILFEQIRPSFLLETQLLKYYDLKAFIAYRSWQRWRLARLYVYFVTYNMWRYAFSYFKSCKF